MAVDIYGGREPLEMPLYTYAEASRYLNVPVSTIRSWAKGRYYIYANERRFSDPLIVAVGDNSLPLSFHNLVELHVLSALRHFHNVTSFAIRSALDNARAEFGEQDRLLLRDDLSTFGGDVFVEALGHLINLNKGRQIVLKDILKNYLRRVIRDESKIPVKLYPVARNPDSPDNSVSIDPRVSFGRPVVKGTGVSTGVIAARINAGESMETVAGDYGLTTEVIKDVLYYEQAA